jgi:hypothetical protein
MKIVTCAAEITAYLHQHNQVKFRIADPNIQLAPYGAFKLNLMWMFVIIA